MNLLVHIGFHKTATTWLQERLFAAPGTGFSVVAPDGRDCLYFGWEFICGKGWQSDRQGRLETPFDFDLLRVRRHLEELTARHKGVSVISNEDLSGHIWSGGFAKKEIADRLHSVAPEARILITVREQASLILSSYDHFLWSGGLASLPAYLSAYNEFQAPLFNRSHLLFDRTVAYYQRLFGRDRVLVLAYEQFRDQPQSFLDSLTRFAGVAPLEVGQLGHEGRANHRGDALAAAHFYLRRLNLLSSPSNLNGRFAIGSARIWREIVRGLSHAVPTSLARARKQRARLTVERLLGDTYAASNARLAALTGIDLGRMGYVLPPVALDAGKLQVHEASHAAA